MDHPKHYGGAENPYEAIKVIEAWGLGFALGNAVKYIARAGRKDPLTEAEDLEKAAWYLRRHIDSIKPPGFVTPHAPVVHVPCVACRGPRDDGDIGLSRCRACREAA